MNIAEKLEMLATVQFDPANKYIAEFNSITGISRKQTIHDVGQYLLNPDKTTPLHSGVPHIDKFLIDLLDMSERCSSQVQNTPSREEFSALMNLLATKAISCANELELAREGARKMMYKSPARKQYEELEQRYKNLSLAILHDAQAEFGSTKDLDQSLLTKILGESVYEDLVRRTTRNLFVRREEIPSPQQDYLTRSYLTARRSAPDGEEFYRNLGHTVGSYGRDITFGAADCPVLSLREMMMKNIGLLDDGHEEIEFLGFMIVEADSFGYSELTTKLGESFGEYLLDLLPLGNDGFANYNEFTSGNCAGCISSSSDCDFMIKNRLQVAKGVYYMIKCPERFNGSVGIQNGTPVDIDLQDPNRFEPGELEFFGIRS